LDWPLVALGYIAVAVVVTLTVKLTAPQATGTAALVIAPATCTDPLGPSCPLAGAQEMV
jgi:hypothetical protein